MKKPPLQRGFTLIETMIYIVLFGMLMSGAVVSAYQLLGGGDRHQALLAVQEEGTFINRKINWALSGATAVSVSGGNVLTVTRPDLGSESPLVIDGSSARVTLKRGSAAAMPISAQSLAIQSMAFAVDPPTSVLPTAVHVSFSIDDKPFTFGAYLRQ